MRTFSSGFFNGQQLIQRATDNVFQYIFFIKILAACVRSLIVVVQQDSVLIGYLFVGSPWLKSCNCVHTLHKRIARCSGKSIYSYSNMQMFMLHATAPNPENKFYFKLIGSTFCERRACIIDLVVYSVVDIVCVIGCSS